MRESAAMRKEGKLRELNRLATLHTSKALSKLIGEQVKVEISDLGVRKVEELRPVISSEEVVVGVYLPVSGEVKGAALAIFREEVAFSLCDLLVKREPGTTRELTELDKSALKEMGNIISGNYLAVLANMLQVKIIEGIPSFSCDMFGALLSEVIAEFARKTNLALIVVTKFIFERTPVSGYFLILLKSEEMKAILDLLDEKER